MMKQKLKQENLTYLSSYLSKRLKRKFGKGPETCYTTYEKGMMLVHIRQFMTPAEEVLLEQGELDQAFNFRMTIIGSIIEEFKQEVVRSVDVTLASSYADWNYESNTGLLLFIEKGARLQNREQEALRKLMADIGSTLHKVPDEINIIRLHPTICIIECKGVQGHIEKILFRRGHTQLLNERSRVMKKDFLFYKEKFEKVLNHSIIDLFLIWDDESDRYLLVFYLK
ncbi:Na-translocating system protein MpsC family protein [Halalkalibacterium ligniniphilum]|uniref:Na-translocating system protein MpsC family protein n=1 Tax=Halalkalibacterium ligniniphilum TaxID=1134413 RepID=UPI000345C54C|nr:Na-translocating system protein MpsC family protein [Halalkalibacterium ligniniphilum]